MSLGCGPAELDDDIVHKAKMLKRMQVLEEKGTDFATRPLRSLPVIGKFRTLPSYPNIGFASRLLDQPS